MSDTVCPGKALLEWSERGAVLGLKAFSMGPDGRALALDFSAWPRDEAPRADLAAGLDAALQRLAERLRAG